MQEKNLQLERTVFFCDAVIAIAITLLALDIKIERTATGHLQFSDLAREWKVFAAFLLSFINIANFWKTHHSFFAYIKKMDERLLWYNILWLFFIVLIPFSTSLVSAYFFDHIAICIYSLNIFLVAIFQNMIWDYTSLKEEYMKRESIDTATIWQVRLFCNLDMINGLLGIILSFISPVVAFILLFTKLPIILIVWLFYGRKLRQQHREQRQNNR